MLPKTIGKGKISVEVVQDSISQTGDRITTFQLHYPRFVHAEFMTHRVFSRNASSSRAIPVHSMLKTIEDGPAMPIHWGLNEPGMQASTEGVLELQGTMPDGMKVSFPSGEALWREAAKIVSALCRIMWNDGKAYHKQIVNRMVEPYTFINVLMTTTELPNFFGLRHHMDAQPEIQELATCMYDTTDESEPMVLCPGEWHVPYVDRFRDSEGMLQYCDYDGDTIYTLQEAQKVSSSCSAQVSYRKLDQTLEKALRLFDRLVGGEPLHASPFEHQATPFQFREYALRMELYVKLVEGLREIHPDHPDMVNNLASQIMFAGNFRGWTQYRKFMPGENILKFSPPKG